ncbi:MULTISPECIES: flagellar hook assembly protein FlgD [unclassified Novosphingobium]|uniref:flagellar hook assembly protein FlgD n=1 Tax=unclassified Novosphingobium TaxID=2644732 RepID=UPI0012C39417|nr:MULTISPECIES: flagellar hook capping FlgD N-terminal domain-containing protein [unclassified Novosphingobium]MPS71274.1 flagellar hook assembly protein FlgD [Novosphingobium sp.]WRT92730.1 flagellar hook capping FlgD N-terminal domain-containing protein [Novosphingobium sp. RL4]
MTTVSSTTSTTSDTTAASTSGLLTDYNLFLKLLTTQMTNQDPLDPMDTSEYTQQLVQYSQVEQSIQQTGKLEDILSQLTSQQMAQASSYIGREARFDSPVAGLGNAPAHWTYYVDGTPSTITATIKDSSGTVVNTVTLDPTTQGSYEWDGTKADGTKAADGAYTLSITATNAAGNALDTTINSVAIVDDVVTDGTNIMLGVNGIRMSASGLVALAAAGASTDS